jgi:hypothetical protein
MGMLLRNHDEIYVEELPNAKRKKTIREAIEGGLKIQIKEIWRKAKRVSWQSKRRKCSRYKLLQNC